MCKDFKNLLKAFGLLIKDIVNGLGNFLVRVINFLGPVAGSLHGVVSPEEFYRVIMLALSTSGSFYGFIQYVSSHLGEFVTDPNLVNGVHAFIDHCHNKKLPLAIFTFIFLADYLRRKYIHGVQS